MNLARRAVGSAALLLVASLFGCASSAPIEDDAHVAAAELCGGAVCFAPAAVRVSAIGDELQLAAWRGADDACAVPASEPVPVGGTAIELDLHGAAIGAALPIKTAASVQLADTSYATARSVRIESVHGRALASEEATSGTVTVLSYDPTLGTARVRIETMWSSGVHGIAELTFATQRCGA
jgi:hypothetical protein